MKQRYQFNVQTVDAAGVKPGVTVHFIEVVHQSFIEAVTSACSYPFVQDTEQIINVSGGLRQ